MCLVCQWGLGPIGPMHVPIAECTTYSSNIHYSNSIYRITVAI